MYGHREIKDRLTKAFYEFLQTYEPRETPSRIHMMHLYYLRGLAQAGEENIGDQYELSEDLIALKTLFDTLDNELIPLPTQYITVKEKKAIKEAGGKKGNLG